MNLYSTVNNLYITSKVLQKEIYKINKLISNALRCKNDKDRVKLICLVMVKIIYISTLKRTIIKEVNNISNSLFNE